MSPISMMVEHRWEVSELELSDPILSVLGFFSLSGFLAWAKCDLHTRVLYVTCAVMPVINK